MILCSPVTGKLIPITEVPDPVFAERMLGDGFAVESDEQKAVIVKAPSTGIVKVINANRHAVVIETDEGVEVLTHIGVETVGLKGKGFKVLVKEGKRISAGDKMVKVDLRYIRSNAPASMVIVLLSNRPDIQIKLPNETHVRETDVIFNVNAKITATVEQTSSEDARHGEWITIVNPHGIHARPSAVLSKQALAYSGQIWIEKENGAKVDAKSSTAIMSLSLNRGDRARFWSDSDQTNATLSESVKNGLGENLNTHDPAKKNTHAVSSENTAINNNVIIDWSKENKLKVAVATPGTAMGNLFVLQNIERNIPETGGSYESERALLEGALGTAIHAIGVEKNVADEEAKGILEAHQAFLEDPDLIRQAKEVIKKGKSAAFAWNQVTTEQARLFAASTNAYFAARAADMRDINRRILDLLLGEQEAPDYPANSIVVMEEVIPSDVTAFTNHVRGVISLKGSPTSHASIMMRNRGIPSVYHAPQAILQAKNGLKAIVDTKEQLLIINPASQEESMYGQKLAEIEKEKQAALSVAKERGATKDGYHIEVAGNVSSLKEAVSAVERGAEGFGLARSEFLFYGRKEAPSEQEQYELYQSLLNSTEHDVTVRLLDAGADKPLDYVKIPQENNPQLGIRGVRIFADNEQIYRTQIRALLRCKPLSRLKIMVPMISLLSEVKLMDAIVQQEKIRLGLNETPRLGIMAETPAVCVMASQFAPHVDFFSIGTNDLTQYTMAMDRENTRLASLASAANPAVLAMVNALCRDAGKQNKPVAVCGAAASERVTAVLFVGLGVTELSAAGETIPEVKATLRKYTMAQLQAVAQKALTLSSEEEVIALVNTELAL